MRGFGNRKSVSIAGKAAVSHDYEAKNGNLLKSIYANGNLLSDGKYTYSWTKGSLLEKVTGDGLEAVYTYDASGIRTSKKVNGITTEYLTAGGSVLSEKKKNLKKVIYCF